jgi:cation:H+ antiporter
VGSRLRHPLVALAVVVGLTVPWLALYGTGRVATLPTGGVILASGVAVVGAAFVLTWGAETAEVDVPRSFALAVLAVIAVAPEYAVDALYAWEAGAAPGTPASENAANLAVANMTGANRILVGLGWSLIAVYAIYRARTGADEAISRRGGILADSVRLEPRIGVEIVFLGAATLYAMLVPFGGGIDGLDAVVLVGLMPVAVVGGMLPGGGRQLLWRWVTAALKTALVVVAMAALVRPSASMWEASRTRSADRRRSAAADARSDSAGTGALILPR